MKLPIYSTEHNQVGNLDLEETLVGCFETGSYLIGIPMENARLFADDELLELDNLRKYWIWEPGFFAGEVDFDLELPGKVQVMRYTVDVGPAEHKTGRAQYADYLRQIVDYAPSLVAGAEPAMHGLGGRSSNATHLWLRYARLRQFIDRYLSSIKAISEKPIVRMSSRRELIALPMTKRVDGITMQQLTSNPEVLSALTGRDTLGVNTNAWDHRLDVPFHEPTMNNPANRLIARQLGNVRRLTRSLLNDIENYQPKVSETKADLMIRLPRRIRYLQSLDERLARLSRKQPFVSVDIEKQEAAEFNAISGNPLYNLAHRVGIRILRQGLSDLANDEQHYLAPTWEIYEAWCFVALAEGLEARFPELTWTLKTNPKSADMVLHGIAGYKEITLYNQLVCKSLESYNRYGYCSISRERRPDLTLEVKNQTKKHFICLDSKYTASRGGILNSMASAHIYQDSLRCGAQPPVLSIILVPANPALSRLDTADYWQRHRVGCFTLKQKSDVPTLLDRLVPFFE